MRNFGVQEQQRGPQTNQRERDEGKWPAEGRKDGAVRRTRGGKDEELLKEGKKGKREGRLEEVRKHVMTI